MPLDPYLASLREARLRDGVRPLYEMSVAEARAADLASIRADRGESVPVGEVRELTVPGAEAPIPARLYSPAGPGPHPLVLYFYGGGWVLGNLETCDGICRRLCAEAECAVLAVGYRLAPEHPFPAAPLDCHAALRWAAGHAADLGAASPGAASPGAAASTAAPGPAGSAAGPGGPAGWPRLAVAGDSAGGNLAAAVTLLARDRGGPPLRCQVLIYPNVDHAADTPSRREHTDPCFFNRRSVAWYWEQYLARPEDGADPLASPLLATDHSGLPPALVVTAEYDPLRDEAELYAHRLAAAGVPVEATRYDGVTHGFFTMTGPLAAARKATSQVADYLRRTLS